MIVRLSALAVAAALLAPPLAKTDAADDVLTARVRSRISGLSAKAWVYAKHVPSGREVAIGADEPVNTVSVIKIAIMVQAFREADAGRLRLDARHTIRPEEMRGGTGLLQTFAAGLNPTHRDLVKQLMVTSDNTATDIMIAKLGQERVNAMLAALGYKETRLLMTIGQLFRGVWEQVDAKNKRLTDREVFDKGFPEDETSEALYMAYVKDPAKWFGRTTPREISRLLEQIESGSLASAGATREMRGMLKDQFYFSRLPQRIRFRAEIGHKTGDWPPIIGNDVGIIYSKNGPIVVSVFTNENTGSFFDLEAAIGLIAEDLLDAWGGTGR